MVLEEMMEQGYNCVWIVTNFAILPNVVCLWQQIIHLLWDCLTVYAKEMDFHRCFKVDWPNLPRSVRLAHILCKIKCLMNSVEVVRLWRRRRHSCGSACIPLLFSFNSFSLVKFPFFLSMQNMGRQRCGCSKLLFFTNSCNYSSATFLASIAYISFGWHELYVWQTLVPDFAE